MPRREADPMKPTSYRDRAFDPLNVGWINKDGRRRDPAVVRPYLAFASGGPGCGVGEKPSIYYMCIYTHICTEVRGSPC